MKQLFTLIFCVFTMSLSAQTQEPVEPDYIESGYYQLIYEADIAYKEGNEDLAFEKYEEAEKRCPLLNQPMYGEMECYSILLLKRGMYDKALHYIEKMATEYGAVSLAFVYLFYEEGTMLDDISAVYPNFADSIAPAILAKANDFYTPERQLMIDELTTMLENEQSVRYELEDARNDASKPQEDIKLIGQRMKEIDKYNAGRMIEIIEQYGFPNSRLYGSNNPRLVGIDVIFAHNYDNETLRELAMEHVRKGNCAPRLYGFIVDRERLDLGEGFVYWIYDNAGEDRIEDIEHLDERRIAIGMPTREMEIRRNELMKQREQGEL
jgi:hypothetical protein